MEMEDERSTKKHGKRKIQLPFRSVTVGGEGGITGLLVFGGALAVAGFMAVASFATKKNKPKRIHPQQFLLDEVDRCKSEDHHETTKTLSSLQHSSTTQVEDATCCWTSNMSTNPVSSSELLSAQPLMEEKFENKPNSVEENPTCIHQQEIAFSDYSHPESATSSNENQVAEEEEEKEEPQDVLTSTETKDEYDDDVDMKSNDAMETDEEDSTKAIGTNSLDYNEEPVWTTAPKEATLNKEANFSVLQKDQPSILTTWVMPMLLLALLSFLVLLTHGLREYLYVLDDGDSVLVP